LSPYGEKAHSRTNQFFYHEFFNTKHNMNQVESLEWSILVGDYEDWTSLPPVAVESIVLPSGQENQIYSKEELVMRICEYGTRTPDEARERFSVLMETATFAQGKFTEVGREKRRTREDTIYHAIRMAYLLASNGITDMTVLHATILHDVHEDANVSLSEITQLFGADVATLVDAVTKVRMNKINGSKKSSALSETGETATLEKFYDDAFGTDHRAIYIKVADVADNSATYHVHDADKAKHKAAIALKYFAPAADRVGLVGLANLIKDNAMLVLHPKEFQEVMQLRETLRVDEMTQELRDVYALCIAFKDNDLDVELDFASISTYVPGAYEAYLAAPKHKITREQVLPELHIVIHHWSDIVKWQAFFHNRELSTEGISSIDQLISEKQSIDQVIHISLRDRLEAIKVSFLTISSTVSPVLLDMTGAHLTDKQEKLARKSLQRIHDSYREVSKQKNMVEKMAESLSGEVALGVSAPDGGVFEFNQKGVTVLDFAHRMGRNLGNHAFGAKIKRGAITIEVPLSHALREGDVVYIDADRKNGKNNTRVKPDRFDYVVTEKARKDTADELNRLLQDPLVPLQTKKEISQAAHARGVDIVKWLYEMEQKKHLPLDFSIEYGFNDDRALATYYKDKDDFLTELGFIALSRPQEAAQRKDALAVWNDTAQLTQFKKGLSVTSDTQRLAYDALRLAYNLVQFRESRPTLRIKIHQDAPGYLESIGHIVGKFDISVLPLHGRADLYSKGKASLIDICLIDGDIDASQVQSLLAELKIMVGTRGSVEFIIPEKLIS
jgi:DNA-binding ferritin-like protein (Dps family)